MSGTPYPEFVVTLEGQEPFTAKARFQDLTIVERQMAAEGLPSMQEAPMSWAARVSYYAAKRTGQIQKTMPYDAYEQLIESIETEIEEDGELEVDPT